MLSPASGGRGWNNTLELEWRLTTSAYRHLRQRRTVLINICIKSKKLIFSG